MADNLPEDSDFEELLFDSSKKTAVIATDLICNHPHLFKKLIDFALQGKSPFDMRAARVVQLVSIQQPGLVKPHLPRLINQLPSIKNDGLKRGILKTIADGSFDYDENTAGILVSYCFDWLNQSKSPVAIKIYAMDILYRMSNRYPEIRTELISSIENQLFDATPAIKSRGQKYLHQLYLENTPK